jgi:hypothetical protein
LVDDPRASTAAIAVRSVELLGARAIAKPGEVRRLESEEAFYRDLRNHAAHEPEATFDEARFARAAVGIQLQAAVDYFNRLYAAIAASASKP